MDHGCQGLGSYSTHMEPSGKYRTAHRAQGPFFHPMDAIRHNRDISRAWTTFILDKSNGFTQAGVERLNDSIMTFVWSMLGSQVQARINILKARTGLDAQKQFMANAKTRLPRPSTSLAVSPAIRKCFNTRPVLGYGVWEWALPVTERHGTPSGERPEL